MVGRTQGSKKAFDHEELRWHAIAGVILLLVCAFGYVGIHRLSSVRCNSPDPAIDQLQSLVGLQGEVLLRCGMTVTSPCPASLEDFVVNAHRVSSMLLSHFAVCVQDPYEHYDELEILR